MADSAYTFAEPGGVVREDRTINAPAGSTTGDVLTVQADGSVAPDTPAVSGVSSVTDGSTTVDPATSIDFTSGATVTDGGGGIAQVAIGGSQPGAVRWIGPYTVGFADFDPETYTAEVMTPTAGDMFLGGRVKLVVDFDNGVDFSFAAGTATDGPGTYMTSSNFGQFHAQGAGSTYHTTGLYGADVGINQDGDTKAIQNVFGYGILIESDNPAPRIFLYTNQLPTQGSALVYLCFATPEAP